MGNTGYATETHCHCGAAFNGSDHCPECGCEQYEATCDHEAEEGVIRIRRDKVRKGDLLHSSHGYKLYITEIRDNAVNRHDSRMVYIAGRLHGAHGAHQRSEIYEAGGLVTVERGTMPPQNGLREAIEQNQRDTLRALRARQGYVKENPNTILTESAERLAAAIVDEIDRMMQRG